MKTKQIAIHICMLATLLLALSAHAQFQWANRIASIANWPEGEPNIGLALDTNDNCYVTGYFDDTNDFGGVTLTNQSVGGSDFFLAKYNSTGALQWVQQAGESVGNVNYGRGAGTDTNGNVYVTGGYQGPSKFGGVNLAATSGEQFFLAKYNSAGTVQWVQSSTGGNGDNNGIGLAVDSAGNSYALAVMDYSGTSITFGTKTVTAVKGGTTFAILVKYNNAGVAQWAQLFDTSQETYATKLAVDAAGNIYVRGLFESDMTIGSSNLVVSVGSTQNAFIAKFNNSGALIWVQQPQGGNAGEGGVAVDPAGNVFVSGYFNTNLDFGGGITLTNTANSSALFGDAFVAKYNSAGAIQWAQPAGGTNGGFYWDLGLDAQTNIYAAGFLGLDAATAKYNSAGTFQWAESASGPPASPVSSGVVKCAVDSIGNSYLAGFYRGAATFGATTLPPQETWNFFLTEVASSNGVAESSTDFTFITNNGAITITGFTGSGGAVTIPEMINGLTVTSIGNEAFFFNTTLTNITIPTSVTSIGFAAFEFCVSLPSVTISASVTNIGNGAFLGCASLTAITVDAQNSVYSSMNGVLFDKGQTTIVQYPCGLGGGYTVPNSVTSIGFASFEFCGELTGVIIPGSITNIGNNAFYECASLTSVTIPNSVTSIGEIAFEYCYNLTNVTIGNSVNNIGEAAFGGCTSLTAITVDTQNSVYSSMNGVLFDENQITLIAYPGGITGSYTIPGSVTNIGPDAFDGSSLTSVTIPNNVTSIGYNAFELSSLTNVTIAGNVTNIGDYAFMDCSSLIGAYFEGNAPYDDGTVFNYDNSATVYYLPGTSGWGSIFGGVPTALWFLPNPLILNSEPSFGVQNNQFGFTISWATNLSVVVEASTNLTTPVWFPISTNALIGGTSYFSDPAWTNYPSRFYRISSP